MTLDNFGTGGYQNSLAAGAASDARRAANDAKRDVGQLEDELARLKLVCAAVWELLKQRGKLTEDDLAAKVAEIDARDGVADGKMTRAARKCANCGRTVSAKQFKCMYCGSEQPVTSVFESI